LNPKARYIQFKVIFKTNSGKLSPRLQKTLLFYLQTNLEPVLTKLEYLPPNVVFLKPPEQNEVIQGAVKDIVDSNKNKAAMAYMAAKKVERKGYQTIVWDAVDENGDVLVYTISARRENESQWRILKKDWREKIFAFDTVTLPDGVYFIKVEASDRPSNPVGMELGAEKISRPLVIDNSLPVVSNLQVSRTGSQLSLSFSAQDSFSHIKEVKFLIRPDGWRVAFPTDGICDSKREDFNMTLTLPGEFDNMITVKAIDSKGNVGVHQATF
jgi:hypothetical protein